jgi:hypothetical protein
LGLLSFGDKDADNVASIGAYRDAGTWTHDSSEPTRLVFSTTADGASSPTERLRITSAGLVGIGTSSPDALLEIEDSTGGTSFSIHNTGTSGRQYILQSTSSAASIGGGKFAIYDGDAPAHRFVIDSSGRVGIGNTDPGTLLTIGGSASSAGKIWLRDTSNNNTLQLTTVVSGTYNEIDSQIEFNLRTESGALRFTTNNTERGRWTSDGKFLVGTSTAESATIGGLLQVQSTGSSAALLIKRNSANTNAPYIYLAKSRGANNATTIVASGDSLGELRFARRHPWR